MEKRGKEEGAFCWGLLSNLGRTGATHQAWIPSVVEGLLTG